MAHPNAKPKEEIELRREMVRSLMAQGYRKPSRILANKKMYEMYSTYKSPYNRVREDMAVVAKENEAMIKAGLKDNALGTYITGLFDLLVRCNKDYHGLEGNAKVGMGKLIKDTLQDIARAFGIDPEKIDPRSMIVNFEQNIMDNQNKIDLPDEVYDQFATTIARELSKANKRASEKSIVQNTGKK
jgi:hypothetical protein